MIRKLILIYLVQLLIMVYTQIHLYSLCQEIRINIHAVNALKHAIVNNGLLYEENLFYYYILRLYIYRLQSDI